MMRVLFTTIVVLFFFGCSTSHHFRTSDPEIVEITRPQVDRWELENGLTVLFMEDNELPLVNGALLIPGGTRWESSDSLGVLSMMGSMLRSGGTEKLGPEALDRELRELAAHVSSGYGDEYGTISFNSLAGDLDEVFEIFSDVLLRPRFDETRLSLLKTQSIEGIRRRKDEPDSIARVTANYLLYQRAPQSGFYLERDVKALTRTQLLRAHRRYVRPNGAYLVVSGDVTRESVEKLVNKHLNAWERGLDSIGEPHPIPQPGKPGIYFVEGDFNQATTIGVQPGPERHDKDRYAIQLFNEMFGGGLDSRLMKSVRADRGLAYSVYAATVQDFQVGKNFLYIQTKTSSVYEALRASLDEFIKMQEMPPGDVELKLSQQAAQSGFVFKFTSPEQILTRMVALELLKFPEDYDEKYVERIFNTTPQDIQRITEKWWKLDELRLVIVGNREAYEVLQAGMKKDPLLSRYSLHKITFSELPHGIVYERSGEKSS